MKDSDAKRKAREPRSKAMPSGYVYLGQFIAHDLVRDIHRFNEYTNPASSIRTPRLDLDHLYGDAAEKSLLFDNAGRLFLGRTIASPFELRTGKAGYGDLPRDPDGTPKLADPRSDENLIIAQMHVLWSKLHNCLLDLLLELPELALDIPGESLFERARNLLTWHYQWIAWYDFLPHVVRLDVLKDVEQNGPRLFVRRHTPGDPLMALPAEFTMAAFRFGHSMVQQSYRIQSHRFLGIEDILKTTKLGGGITNRLPATHVIDWRFFFGRDSALINRGQNIDTFISEALYELGGTDAQAFLAIAGSRPLNNLPSKVDRLRLPEMTLIRGSKACLPSGEEFAERFHYEPLLPKRIHALPEDESFFKQAGIRGRTPLWYYLLREAAVEEKAEPATDADREPIQKLGRIGSRIVAETLYQVLSADRDSIFNAGKNWRPPIIELPASRRLFRLRSMKDIVNLLRAVS